MLNGLLLAIGANALWATAFIAPLLLPDTRPIAIVIGRYVVFGLSSLLVLAIIAWRARRSAMSMLRSPRAWGAALVLTLFGNVIYYVCLATALRLAGTAMPTLIIGMLPVIVAVLGAVGERGVPWGALLASCALIVGGLVLVHMAGARGTAPLVAGGTSYGAGVALAFAALASWTVYGMGNAAYLRRHPGTDMVMWTSMTGTATLPLLVPLFAFVGGLGTFAGADATVENGVVPFAVVSLALGLGTSWAATWAWNGASAVLPTRLLGQLIVVETLMALVFAAVVRWEMPSAAVGVGAAMLLAGVLWGIRVARTNDAAARTVP